MACDGAVDHARHLAFRLANPGSDQIRADSSFHAPWSAAGTGLKFDPDDLNRRAGIDRDARRALGDSQTRVGRAGRRRKLDGVTVQDGAAVEPEVPSK